MSLGVWAELTDEVAHTVRDAAVCTGVEQNLAALDASGGNGVDLGDVICFTDSLTVY